MTNAFINLTEFSMGHYYEVLVNIRFISSIKPHNIRTTADNKPAFNSWVTLVNSSTSFGVKETREEILQLIKNAQNTSGYSVSGSAMLLTETKE